MVKMVLLCWIRGSKSSFPTSVIPQFTPRVPPGLCQGDAVSALRFSLVFPPLLAKVPETKEEDLIFYKPHCGTGEMILFPGREAAGFGSGHCFQWID